MPIQHNHISNYTQRILYVVGSLRCIVDEGEDACLQSVDEGRVHPRAERDKKKESRVHSALRLLNRGGAVC